jgi:hypothetical protein
MLETYNDVKHYIHLQVQYIGFELELLEIHISLSAAAYTRPHFIFLNFSSFVSFSIFLGFLKCVEIQFKEKG